MGHSLVLIAQLTNALLCKTEWSKSNPLLGTALTQAISWGMPGIVLAGEGKHSHLSGNRQVEATA